MYLETFSIAAVCASCMVQMWLKVLFLLFATGLELPHKGMHGSHGIDL
jgi:uncharacterized membrane protein